jgi:hypothetical protein
MNKLSDIALLVQRNEDRISTILVIVSIVPY